MKFPWLDVRMVKNDTRRNSSSFQRSGRFRPRFRARLHVLAAATLLVPLCAAHLRAEHGASDERIQALYRQAKEAEANGDSAAAIKNYETILEIAPRLGSAYNNLGLLYFRRREYEKAAHILQQGLKMDPAMSTASALLGISLSELGRYAEARPNLERALRQNPKDKDAEKFLANDLIKLGDLEAAAGHLRALSRREPGDQEVWYLLGQVYMHLSEQALAKMNSLNPDSELVHEMSGEIMENMKNYDGALFEYKKAADMAPQKPGIHYKLGNVYWTIAQWDAATREFEAELVNDPLNCKAQALIGDILVDQKMDFEQGLSELDKALAICPDLAPAKLDRGRALLKLNRNEEALKELEKAAQASPDDPQAHFFLAQAYRGVGRIRDAQAEMQAYSSLEEHARASTAGRARALIESKEAPH